MNTTMSILFLHTLVCARARTCVCIPHSPLEVLFPITGTLPVLSGPAIICGWAFNNCIVCVFHSESDPLSLLLEKICGFTSSAFLDLRAFLATGAYMGHCVCVRLCVWGYCLYRLLVLMFRSVLACVNMKLFGSVHAIAMLYIIVCMCAFPRTV